jgi:hypothetical protein
VADDTGTHTHTQNRTWLSDTPLRHCQKTTTTAPCPRTSELSDAVIGPEQFVITLDDGRRVKLADTSDCCAYTELREFLLHPEAVDHAILGVGTTGDYTTWHIYADFGDVMEPTRSQLVQNGTWLIGSVTPSIGRRTLRFVLSSRCPTRLMTPAPTGQHSPTCWRTGRTVSLA